MAAQNNFAKAGIPACGVRAFLPALGFVHQSAGKDARGPHAGCVRSISVPLGLHDDLNTLVLFTLESLVTRRCIVELEPVRDDERRINPPGAY